MTTYGALCRRASTRVALRPRSCMQNASTYGTVRRSVNGASGPPTTAPCLFKWLSLRSRSHFYIVCFAQHTKCCPSRMMQFNDYLMRKPTTKLCVFLVYMYYTHPCYQTSIFGKNCAYYIRIFTVTGLRFQKTRTRIIVIQKTKTK